jgi:arylsulfatase A-like enzyme
MKHSIPFYTASLASLAWFIPENSHAAESQKMNVLLLIADDMRVEVGVYGDSLAKTPNIDRLSAQGVRFERAYCQYPLSCPSRTSMLTGMDPTTTGVYGNREWYGNAHPDWVSLPMYFRNHGFTTLRTGKVFHAGIDDTDAWVKGGELRIHDKNPGKPQPQAAPQPLTDEEFNSFIKTMIKLDTARASESDRWEAVVGDAVPNQKDTLVANVAIEYLRDPKRKTEPFFMVCGFSKPHSPLVAPKRFFDLYKTEDIPLPVDFAPRPTLPAGFPAASIRPMNADLFINRNATPQEAKEMIRAYLACISYMDWNLGRVVDELKAQGLDKNTIVAFWSDHGYQLGEKGKWSKAGSLWEKGTRVPFVVYDPRSSINGKPSKRIVQAIDIYPTLVELAGLPVPTTLEGRSLAPLLKNPEAEWNHPAYTVWNEHGKGITGVAVRTERWRYAEFFGHGAGAMLTDPINDPHELTNLVNDPRYADVVKELSALARKHVEGKTEPTPKG